MSQMKKEKKKKTFCRLRDATTVGYVKSLVRAAGGAWALKHKKYVTKYRSYIYSRIRKLRGLTYVLASGGITV